MYEESDVCEDRDGLERKGAGLISNIKYYRNAMDKKEFLLEQQALSTRTMQTRSERVHKNNVA